MSCFRACYSAQVLVSVMDRKLSDFLLSRRTPYRDTRGAEQSVRVALDSAKFCWTLHVQEADDYRGWQVIGRLCC